MPQARRHRSGAVFFVGLQLALSVGTAANLVFCSTASGHVAVESAFDADCCPRPPLAQTFGRFHADDDCGCIDTPLLQSPIEARSRSELLVSLGTVVLAPVIEHVRPSPLALSAWASQALVPEQRLAVRRSVVLLL
jgi:hypothetical protein